MTVTSADRSDLPQLHIFASQTAKKDDSSSGDKQFAWDQLAPSSRSSDPEVSTEMVEDLPLTLVRAYADIACRHARVTETDAGVWFADVVGLEGAWGDGSSPEEAEEELREAIIGWVAVKRRMGATDIPPIEGIDLNLARR
jgi:predicted RNase H-like HicB family nuclease